MTKENTDISLFKTILEAVQTAIQPLGMQIGEFSCCKSIKSNRQCLGESKPKTRNKVSLEIEIIPIQQD